MPKLYKEYKNYDEEIIKNYGITITGIWKKIFF